VTSIRIELPVIDGNARCEGRCDGRVANADTGPLLAPEERVLSTLNEDGSRRWMSPRLFPGVWRRRRMILGWFLILLFAVLPWLRIDGKPVILLDVMTRKFVFLGETFRPTDTPLLALVILGVFVSIFLLTALFGRVWCGWGCPQTVYLDFLYRPIERFFLKRPNGVAAVGAPPVAAWRRVAMYAAFLLASAHLANTFLAYFVGTDRLVAWTWGSPLAHPTAFLVFAVVTGLMMFDFCFFREQLCTLVCPYGRFQSVLLDRDSPIIGYDRARAEPRGRTRKGEAGPRGDCIDCTMCVQACPTGIDIRDGLQLECVACAACIDACDGIMDKVGKPRGLIRYTSQNGLDGKPARLLRVRTALYAALLVAIVAALVTALVRRDDFAATQLRAQKVPYAIAADGLVESTVRLRIDNRFERPRTFRVEAGPAARVVAPDAVTVPGFETGEATVTVRSERGSFVRGVREVELRIVEEGRADRLVPVHVVGPISLAPAGR
jgi:cytochrome c oxidase accessory protein FixG